MLLGVLRRVGVLDFKEAGVVEEETLRMRVEAWLGDRGEGVGDDASRGLPDEAVVASDRRLKSWARL